LRFDMELRLLGKPYKTPPSPHPLGGVGVRD
jgi:hypothetical protein